MPHRLSRLVHRSTVQLLSCAVLLGGTAWAVTAHAIIFNLNNSAQPRLSIRVGAGGGNISEVAFSVPAAQLGKGTPVTGSRRIRIRIQIRASGANPLTAFLTVDSFSNPLTNTAPGSTGTIPFSEISWTSRDGTIPAGTYNGTINQPLVAVTSSHRYVDTHTFRYANTLALEAGTYEGRVTYTFAVP